MSPPRFFKSKDKEHDRRDRDGDERGSRFEGPVRKKNCRYCVEKSLRIDYKDGRALRPFVTERGKIMPRRNTGLCAFHQRLMTTAIKRARVMALLSFSPPPQS